MSRNVIETITGAVVIVVAIWFMVFFVNKTDAFKISGDTKKIVAKFDEIDAISIGAPVKIAGVKVGNVSAMELDKNSYQAVLVFAVANDIKIPVDSSVKIASSGLLGEKYISITPGNEEKFIGNGGEIKYTESSVNLETLIGKMIYSSGAGKTEKAPAENKAGQ